MATTKETKVKATEKQKEEFVLEQITAWKKAKEVLMEMKKEARADKTPSQKLVEKWAKLFNTASKLNISDFISKK